MTADGVVRCRMMNPYYDPEIRAEVSEVIFDGGPGRRVLLLPDDGTRVVVAVEEWEKTVAERDDAVLRIERAAAVLGGENHDD